MNEACVYNGRKIWTSADLTKLRHVFSAYQKPEMGTVKWHMLDLLSDDIAKNGGLLLYNAGVYEYSYTIFKQSYEKT